MLTKNRDTEEVVFMGSTDSDLFPGESGNNINIIVDTADFLHSHGAKRFWQHV